MRDNATLLQQSVCPTTRLQLLEYFAQLLDNSGVPYFITYGTLLGAVRDNRMIPWTPDVDICVPNLKLQTHILRKLLEKNPCLRGNVTKVLFRLDSVSSRMECVSESTFGFIWPSRTYIDIYGIKSNGYLAPTVYLVGSKCRRFPEGLNVSWRMLYPINKTGVLIGNRRYPTPHKPKTFLETFYGSTWNIPDYKTSWN